jgi:DNA-binding MarR family transcriptional regulator
VDDATRPTPVADILQVLLSHLEENGFSPENMNATEMLHHKEVSLLEAIQRTPSASQRILSSALGLSLGQTNALIKTLSDKGDLEVERKNGREVRYVITKKGHTRWVRHANSRLAEPSGTSLKLKEQSENSGRSL